MHAFNPNFPKDKATFDLIKNFSRKPFTQWFNAFDSMTGGLYEGQVMLIGGGTGAGKTTLAINLAMSASTKFNVAYISTETIDVEIAQRILSRYSNFTDVPPMSIKILDEHSEMSPKRTRALRYTPQFYDIEDSDVIIVDYLKSEDLDATAGSRNMRELVDSWRRYAEDEQKCVVLFTQIRDFNVYSREATWSDFWLSGCMGQPSYVVMAVSRVKAKKGNAVVAVDVIKNRNHGASEYVIGRFCLELDTNTCEIIDETSVSDFNEIPQVMKNALVFRNKSSFLLNRK